jgi:hypothetical protein
LIELKSVCERKRERAIKVPENYLFEFIYLFTTFSLPFCASIFPGNDAFVCDLWCQVVGKEKSFNISETIGSIQLK